jgi:MarR family transcriptional regulator, transcriptional regulator for hemolysin
MVRSFDESIGMRTNQVSRKIVRYLNRRLVQFEITLEQWIVLAKLVEQEEINQKMLAAKTDKDPAALLRILDVLERKKLVERRLVAGDRRSFSLHITSAGWELKEKVAPFLEGIFQEILGEIPIEKVEIYVDVLKSINHKLMNLEPK